MKHLKYFKESLTNDEVKDIKDIFQDVIDDWELYDLKQGQQPRTWPAAKHTKIEYLYFDNSQMRFSGNHLNSYFEIMLNWVRVPFHISGARGLDQYFDGFFIYINLAGPNDFFRTRSDFLDDLDVVIKRLKVIGYKPTLLEDPHDSNHFILNIKL